MKHNIPIKSNLLSLMLMLMFFIPITSTMGGCGTWAGNPKDPEPTTAGDTSTKVIIDFQGTTDESLQLLASTIDVTGTDGSITGTITMTSARVALRKIKIRSLGGGHDSQEFEGPYIVNLITNTVSPTIDATSITAGKYRDIKLQLAKLEEDEAANIVDASDPLIGNSIHIVGTYTKTGGTAEAFEMLFDLDEEFIISLTSSRSEFSLGKSITNKVIVAFSLPSWFDFNGADSDFDDFPAGPIKLEKDSEDFADDIRKAIKDNVKGSARFGRDKDGDGKLQIEDEEEDEEEDESGGSEDANPDESNDTEDTEDTEDTVD